MLPGGSWEEAARFEFGEDGFPRLRRERHVIAEDRLGNLRRRFVTPPNLDEDGLREDLATYGAVILVGGQGEGLRTAAQMLLVPRGQENDHDIREDLTTEDETPRLDVGALRGGERLLLDLTRNGVPRTREILRELEPLRDRARRTGGRLVVLFDARDKEDIPTELRDHVVRPGRPDPLEVLRRHLDAKGVPGFFPDHASENVREWAVHSSMAEVEELARRVEEVYKERDREGLIGEWLDTALEGDDDKLLEPLKKAEGRGRALLFAASVLEGTSVERLATAVEHLLPMVRLPEDETPLIERTHFRTELSELGLVVGPDRRIRFVRAGQAAAIRAELWDAHPWLHEVFDVWVDTCVRGPNLSPVDRDRVAERWTEQSLRVDRPERVFAAIVNWSQASEKAGNRAPQSAIALSAALKDQRYGRLTRRQVYRWGEGASPDRLAHVLIAVCAQELALTHPERALVRLHLFAGHRVDKVSEAARVELAGLARDRSFHRRAVRRFSDKLRERDVPVDRTLFREMTRPELLLRGDGRHPIEPGVLAMVAEGLPLLLHEEPDRTREYGELWIGRSEQFTEILVAAAARARTLAVLYTTALRLPRGPGDTREPSRRRRDREALLRRIDEAQGIRPARERTAPRKENG
ncbi:hypothetical protein BQ8420_24635 [Nocardiopsis sp. JB363]|nr:hypothetical protein BQ8420_24635 [Nocardiopsis sp. JB363]